MKSKVARICLTAIIMVSLANFAGAQELKDITLPAPKMEGGKPLMQALKERQTSRAYDTKKLPLQTLSDLLWAAFGINRADSGKRTAPSTRNWQEIEIFVVMEEGTYLYDAKANSLKAVASGDLRKMTGTQEFIVPAPLNLVFVADTSKMKGASQDDQSLYAGADVGFISQNVYLFCASEGLATVVRGMIGDKKALGEALKITAEKKIILAQTIGYPAVGK
ncbi:MAG: nitroreductase [Lentisphaerae bacterium GWF2_49_21]|nr:MAG: nitroreductase [Lentisphaerae bacterium GWF2_49_21]